MFTTDASSSIIFSSFQSDKMNNRSQSRIYVYLYFWAAALTRIIFIFVSFPALAPSSIVDIGKYEYMNNVRFSGARNMIVSLYE
jgi:hypothetical protein